jgi:uncharacterized protein YwqG
MAANKCETLNIIELTAQNQQYYGDSIEMPTIVFESGNYVKASQISIPLGCSRYGGPIVDLPPGVDHPADLRFAAQLDLSCFSPHDKSGLLPKTGQLLFFADIIGESGKIIYANVPNDQLVRVMQDHEDNFCLGVLIDQVFASSETLQSRYRDPDDEEEAEDANEEGKLWDYFAGSEKSKIFGIYTHCQLEEEDILEILDSDKILLLQIGEGGFNDEGVLSVLINREDLEKKDFSNSSFAWGQS